MTTLWKLPLVFFLVLFPSLSWGGDESLSDQVSRRWAALFSDLSPQTDTKQTTRPLYQTKLTPTFFAPPMVSPRLRDLAPETDQPRTQGLLSSTTWLNGTLITETEVARSLGGVGWLRSRIPGDTRDDPSQRMVRLGLTSTVGSVRYGALYRSAEQAFLNGPDQAMREVWGEWKTGWNTLRSAIGRQWNNVAGDATRSRVEQTYGRVGLAWKRPTWPELTLTYARNSLSSALEPLGITSQRSYNHTLESALAYAGTGWNARLASSYILGSDLLHRGAETTARMQMITAAFRPLNTLAISPTLGYREELQDWSGVRITSPSASVALQYKQSRQLLISAMGNYADTRSSDGLINTEQVGGKGILAWDVQGSQECTTLISLEAGYNRMTNHVTPATNTEDISGLIRVVLAAL
jgi:hypothetical protein